MPGKRAWIGAAAGIVVGLAAAAGLKSETLTMSTTYPAPSGVYKNLISTSDTVLARDGGNVGIGVTPPTAKLDVAGNANVSGGLSVGGAAAVAGALGVGGGASVTGGLSAGSLTNNGNRTNLVGADGAGYHWVMAGGTAEGVNNALGFNLGSKSIGPGPGWSMSGSVKAVQGSFSVVCPGSCDPGTGGTVYVNSQTVFVPFTPVAATCSTSGLWTDSVIGDWINFYCWDSNIVLGPNYATFTYILAGAPPPLTSNPGLWGINYMIVGQ